VNRRDMKTAILFIALDNLTEVDPGIELPIILGLDIANPRKITEAEMRRYNSVLQELFEKYEEKAMKKRLHSRFR